MKPLLVLLLQFLLFGLFSQTPRDLLQHRAREIGIQDVLVKDFAEIGFPNYANREFWNAIPKIMKDQYIAEAEEYLDYEWPVVKATDYLEIIRSGDRRQGMYAAPRAALLAVVMAELVEGEGRFMDQIINGVWYYSEQTWWGWSAHLPAPRGLPDINNPSIDLGVGEIANVLSWTWFLFKNEFDRIHPFISKRLHDEIMNKAIVPYYERNDFWWMGLDGGDHINNWNPWTNHNLLTAILICESDWSKKVAGVEKVILSLDQFINHYPNDGGCDEGPSYWGRAAASLYQNLDLLKRATNGQFDVYDNELIQNMGNYIYKAYIDYPYFVNFADADATTGSRPQIIYCYGKDINDPVMQQFGAYLAKQQAWGTKLPSGKIDEQLIQLMYLDEIRSAEAKNALVRDFWLPDTEVAGARDQEGATDGFFFCAKGGHNAENHNHNDLGTCVLYFNGKPCLIDIGRETYTAKTFSEDRYDIWTMQSGYHQLPKINGVDQMQGRSFVASNSTFSADADRAVFSTDIASAYPEEAKVKTWVRSYHLDRGEKFTISDHYELKDVTKSTSLNFITACNVVNKGDGVLVLEGEGFALQLKFDPDLLIPKIEEIPIEDAKLQQYWDVVTRIILNIETPKLAGNHQITIMP